MGVDLQEKIKDLHDEEVVFGKDCVETCTMMMHWSSEEDCVTIWTKMVCYGLLSSGGTMMRSTPIEDSVQWLT